MSLKELVHALGTEVCSEERFGRYPDFAPAEETLGFADTSPALDGSRGIAFMCDQIRIRTEKKVIGRDYSDILSVELVPSYESPFADELIIKSHRKDVRVTDYSLNKPALKLLIDSLCAEYNRMSEDEREDAYRESFSAAMEFYCDPSDDTPTSSEHAGYAEYTPEKGTVGAIAMELVSVLDDASLSRGEILERFTEILSGYIPAEADGEIRPKAFIPAFNAGEKFPPENEAVVFTDHYSATATAEGTSAPAEAFDEIVAGEEIPLMDLQEDESSVPIEETEPALVESIFPEAEAPAEDESPAPAEETEPALVESVFSEAETPAEDETPAPAEETEPAPVESAFPEAEESAEDESPAPAEETAPVYVESVFPEAETPAEDETPAPAEETEPAPVESVFPEAETPAEDESSALVEETEPVPVESIFPEAEEPAEDESPAPVEETDPVHVESIFPETEEPAEDETSAPAEETEPAPVESAIPEIPESPEPYIKEELPPEPDVFNEVMESQNVAEMSRTETLSFLKDSINEINAPAEEEESPYTKEPKSDDIYLIASSRLRELCEKKVLTPERMQTELKMSVQSTARNFTEIASNERNIPHELVRRVRDLKRGSSMLQKYMALGEDIASRIMFFMLYQMLVYTDGIEKSYSSALKLGAFKRRFSDIENTLQELNARVK